MIIKRLQQWFTIPIRVVQYVNQEAAHHDMKSCQLLRHYFIQGFGAEKYKQVMHGLKEYDAKD